MQLNGQKVTPDHLKRNAYLYIRQSTLRQVFENTESTKRQYALKERAIALGWPIEKVTVIDTDMGQSGASAADREGFKQLVTEVGMGHAGIVMGLEVSRLARNCSDWHRLLEICALTNTLILDEDGLYNPGDFNDRLLLGLKGAMSEAELHSLKSRLQGGILTKAKRGELQTPIPIGFVYNASGHPVLDPDQQVRKSLFLFFKIFNRTKSATATVKYFRKEGVKFPCKLHNNSNKGEIIWGTLKHWKALDILHNPRYAGAFFFGRTQTQKQFDGKTKLKILPRDQWFSLVKNVHEGYLSWEEYENNLKQLQMTAQAFGADRRKSPPREGHALLQGLVICGICGKRMTVRYHYRNRKSFPYYVCQKEGIDNGIPICQNIPGAEIDNAISHLLIQSVNPLALEVALNIQEELKNRIGESDRLRKQQVERARYEADMARRRYIQVVPENRLVADTLEAEWNDKLRILNETQEEYEKKRKADENILNEEKRAQIMALATDFSRLWNHPKTSFQDKKRMIRLLIEDVTLTRKSGIDIHVRFKGGAIQTLKLETPRRAWELRETKKSVIDKIDLLLNEHTDSEIAAILNQEMEKSGTGESFHSRIISNIRRAYGLKTYYERLKEKNLFPINEISKKNGVCIKTLKIWANMNIIKAVKFNDKNEKLFELPGIALVNKLQKVHHGRNCNVLIKKVSNRINEVQYEV